MHIFRHQTSWLPRIIYTHCLVSLEKGYDDFIEHPLDDVRALHAAAEALHTLGPQRVLVKGGHLPEARERGEVVDVLHDGRNFMEFRDYFDL